jgi:broad specificity phosphatase PhoE
VATLEVRRHSIRKAGGGSQLSQEGVELARGIGATIGPFDRVVATVVPRARETAIAMGFAVDEELVTLTADPALFAEAEEHPWYRDEHPWTALARLVAMDGAHGLYANSMAALLRDLLTPRPDGNVLVIGHSGEIEAALVACLPHEDHDAWGPQLGPCEGARLTFDGEPARFSKIEFLRP